MSIREAVEDVKALERQFRAVLKVGAYLNETADIEQERAETEKRLEGVKRELEDARGELEAAQAALDDANSAVATATARASKLSTDAEQAVSASLAVANEAADKIVSDAETWASKVHEDIKAKIEAHEAQMKEFAEDEQHKLGQIAELENALDELRKRVGLGK